MFNELDHGSLAYLLLEAMPDVIVMVNKEGKIVYVNPQAQVVLGYEKKDLVGQVVEILLPVNGRSKHQHHRMDYLQQPKTRPMGIGVELEALHKNGEVLSVEISLSPIQFKDELFIIAVLRDIGERKRLEKENWKMQESNRLKDMLLKNVSHELRTPLNGIIGFSELLFSESLGPVSPEYKEYLGNILTSSRLLFRLITDVVNFTDIESQKIECRPEQVILLNLIEEGIASLSEMIEKKKIQVMVDIDPGMVTVYLDPIRFKQVVYNYLSNAIKFSPRQAEVKIRVYVENEESFRLEVQDSGIGINAADLKKLFSPFEKFNIDKKNYPGLGLGLMLTKRIVESQGGSVGVQSTPGKGSIFYAILRRFQIK